MSKVLQFIGQSPKFQEVLRTADLVAGTDVPVLLSGETGTGKDMLAQRIHANSRRKQRALVKVNCASSFVEDDIFKPKKGAIARANKASLFLDEVAALPDIVQLKLLNFLEKESADIRIIASTRKNLGSEVKEGHFRAELLYRLNVIPIELPALKDRQGDVEILMDYFLRQLVAEQHQPMPEFSKQALKRINQYEWSGNVRELYNFCERMFILFSGKQVSVTNLPREFRQYTSRTENIFSLPETGIKLDAVEIDFILQALNKTSGNKSQAARLLGLSRDTFLYRLKKYSIEL